MHPQAAVRAAACAGGEARGARGTWEVREPRRSDGLGAASNSGS